MLPAQPRSAITTLLRVGPSLATRSLFTAVAIRSALVFRVVLLSINKKFIILVNIVRYSSVERVYHEVKPLKHEKNPRLAYR